MSATGSLAADRGMTLLEALVVVAITALIGGITFPAIGKIHAAAQFHMTVATFGAALKQAQAEAIRRQIDVRVIIAGDGRSYRIGNKPSQTLPDTAQLKQISRQPGMFMADGSSNGGRWLLTDGARRAGFAASAAFASEIRSVRP